MQRRCRATASSGGTRPYAWKSLRAAKALFIVVFINLPMLLAQALILRAYGFSLGAVIPGLLWNQALLSAVLVLPMAALAAVTTGFVQLPLTILILSVSALLYTMAAPRMSAGSGSGPLSWVTSLFEVVMILVVALAVIVWQYK
jgi:hypothetical protein